MAASRRAGRQREGGREEGGAGEDGGGRVAAVMASRSRAGGEAGTRPGERLWGRWCCVAPGRPGESEPTPLSVLQKRALGSASLEQNPRPVPGGA